MDDGGDVVAHKKKIKDQTEVKEKEKGKVLRVKKIPFLANSPRLQ